MISSKKYISTTELAKMLGISRVAVFQKIQNGQIPAEKIGRNYAIALEVAQELVGKAKDRADDLSDKRKNEIEKVVQKVISEYGETLRLLAKE